MNVGVAEIRNNFAELLNRVAYAGERVVLERRGKGVAALVSMDDLELLEKLDDEVDIKAARAALKEKGEVAWQDVKAELGLRGLGKGSDTVRGKGRRTSKAKA